MSAVVERLAGMSQVEVRSFFADTEVVEITALIRAMSDEELQRLIALDHFREEGVVAILDRFAEFADPDRLATVDGAVRFRLTRGQSPDEVHTVRFTDGAVALDQTAAPDVTITAEIGEFVRLVTGQSNAALLYLSGQLDIDGDELLALAVGTLFTVPGTDHVAVDPTSLDPVDVATAVARTSGAHMRKVMAGGFRPIVLEEVFRRFPDFVDDGRAGRLSLSVGFRIGGRADGEVDRYVVHLRDGACTIEVGAPEGQRRDATISLEGADFLRLATGQLHPVKGVLTGQLKVRGDRGKALALNGAMNPPQPRPA